MEGLRTPGAPGCERERPLAVRWEDRERPIRVSTVATGDVQYPGSARVETGAPVLCTEDKSGAPDFKECILGVVLLGSRSGQDWMARVLSRRYLYSHGGWWERT